MQMVVAHGGLDVRICKLGVVDLPDNPDGETEELAMMNALKANRHIHNKRRELLQRSRITGLEVEGIMKDLSPLMFEDFVKPFQIDADEEEPSELSAN
ncbi:unnamed protein product [Arabis nemorensis]|uniref:Uncharacterized protein n=1 Tax=Arabis nemorensis TaxID=586526 RepID=A0A565BIG4_9BRAS|nr:unnamed protein product [Arabis nemorensis]